MLAQVRYRLPGDPQELGDDLLAAAAFERGVTGEGAEQRGTEAVDIGRRGRRITPSTSGAVKAGDPVTTPVAVSKPPAMCAIPKSANSGSP